MRILVQRTTEASVIIKAEIHGEINRGMVVLLGIETEDTKEDADWLIQKICGLRIFSDDEGKMNLSSQDINGAFLVISQFTLHASTKKGNRPSYIKAARPETAVPLYDYFIEELMLRSQAKVATGVFGADMKVTLVNDGPVTFWIDSKNRE
ncbi:MAG: D-aminoacyl-tRNA deacylase [Crocinitomicaceae bacterium]